MEPHVTESLREPHMAPWHVDLFNHAKQCVYLSRNHMAQYYPKWDRYDAIYHAFRYPDRADYAARDRKEPEKMVVPVAYSQLMTFVTFTHALYSQRERFFELIGTGLQDQIAAKIGEALLARDLDKSGWDSRLYQYLLDIGRFGIGVLKNSWVRETQVLPKQREVQSLQLLGRQVGQNRTETVNQEAVKFMGNRIMNVSPYRFFPDPRLPLSRFQDGEFAAVEDEYSYQQLKDLERQGVVAGIEYVPPMSAKTIEARGVSRLAFTSIMDPIMGKLFVNKSKGPQVIDEVIVKIVPREYMIGGKPLGPEDFPVLYNLWYANDTRLIKAEPFGYLHNQFPYVVGQFNPDMHQLINPGLMETVEQLQDLLTWYLNAHVTNVRKVVQNTLVVDPSGVEMKDLHERNPVIRLKTAAARSGVDKWIKQLNVTDVTARHMEDAGSVEKLIEMCTGINDNLQGQYHTGRRSAQESRQVQANGSNRLITIAKIIWCEGLRPLAGQMISNLQDGLDEQTFVRVIGDVGLNNFNGFVPVSKAELVGNYDFEVFNGTLPSTKSYQADVLKELLTAMLQNPEVIQMIGYDPKALLREILALNGIKSPERFILQPPGQPQPGEGQEAPVENQPERQMNGAPTIQRQTKSGNPNEPIIRLIDAGAPTAGVATAGVISY